MKWDTKTPCKSCPYRKDAKLGFWHAQEFIDLLHNDEDGGFTAPLYGCHGSAKQAEPSICAGWLLDQKGRMENIQLRLALLQSQEARDCFDAVSCDVELYGSLREMVMVNLKAMRGEEE